MTRSWPANESKSSDAASSRLDATCRLLPPPANTPRPGKAALTALNSSRASSAPLRTAKAVGRPRVLAASAASTARPALPRSFSPRLRSASRAPAVAAPLTGVVLFGAIASTARATSLAQASTSSASSASPKRRGTRSGPPTTRTAPSQRRVPRQTQRVLPEPASTTTIRLLVPRRRRCSAHAVTAAAPRRRGTRSGPPTTRTAPSQRRVPKQTQRVLPEPASTTTIRLSVPRRRRCNAQAVTAAAPRPSVDGETTTIVGAAKSSTGARVHDAQLSRALSAWSSSHAVQSFAASAGNRASVLLR